MRRIFPLFLILIFLLTACGGGTMGTTNKMKTVELEYWRVWDDKDNFREILDKYSASHPYIKINYRKLRFDEYEQALLEAFAVDQGPDVFSIHNTWLQKYHDKGWISPLPPSTTIAHAVVKGHVEKEIVPELKTKRSLNLKELQTQFIDTVYDDVVITDYDKETKSSAQNIYGLPLSVDTLALFYNRDLLNNAGITEPPKYWNKEFQRDIKKLIKQNNRGEIVQAGVAMGGSENIERFSDILSVLMMQNGSEMISSKGSVAFQRIPSTLVDVKYNPGLEALRFYSDFANPAKEVYTWNKDLDYSLDMFSDGRLAMIFGYSYHMPIIKTKNPNLNFLVSALPQIEGNKHQINFANYWIESVAQKTEHKDEAWDFIQYITNIENVEPYLEASKKPTALRSLIEGQISDLDIGVFADQLLTAKSWYRGQDSKKAEEAIATMIDTVVESDENIMQSMNFAANQVQQTLK